MHRKIIAVLLLLVFLPVSPVMAEEHLAMTVAPNQFTVGNELHIYFTLPKEGTASLLVRDSRGQVCATLLKDEKLSAGAKELTWDGVVGGQALAPGGYKIHLMMGPMSVDMDVTITGEGAAAQAAGSSLDMLFADPAEETADSTAAAVEAAPVAEPTQEPEPVLESISMTPAYKSTYTPAHEGCYWCTPMDITDEAAVWAMLTAPVTIVKGDHQKSQVILRAEPSDDSEGVGVVTCISQSVHVLETRDDGWSLVETYSSSFHDSKVKAWNLFVTGYIKTNRLETKKPSQEYGIVIDKLTQELYLFKDGKLFSNLLVSTGEYNEKQPYNETRSGEFLIVSRVGEFRSDNMFCSMALRFNSGDLLHEVPHVKNADGTKNYKNTEPKLGTRASHGCIRTQRLRNADGVNMAWLWNNIDLNTKMVIWEDYAGRFMPPPDPSIQLFYNENKGSNYHLTENCTGVRDEYLPLTGTLTYGELEDSAYQKLTPCVYCIPPRRMETIDKINEIHETVSPGEVPQHLRQKK